MEELKVVRTTFKVDGIDEPCIMVGEGYAQVRISKCYHLVGEDSLYVREILDGEFNGEDEFAGDFDELTDEDAIRIAKEFSAYIND